MELELVGSCLVGLWDVSTPYSPSSLCSCTVGLLESRAMLFGISELSEGVAGKVVELRTILTAGIDSMVRRRYLAI